MFLSQENLQKINEILNEKSNELKFKYISFYDLRLLGFPEANNIVKGDVVGWVEAVFTGSFRNAKFSHFEFKWGKITKESYGIEKGQHTFTIESENGEKTRKKGRTIFKEVCLLLSKAENREAAQAEKNERGNKAMIISLQKWLDENDFFHPRYNEKKQRLENILK
jgi:hypothetical protein